MLYEFKGEDQLLKSVAQVGKLFNFYRENLDEYKNDEQLVSAYCAYYLTTNYPKLFETLKLLGQNFDLNSFSRVVDIGTGPGTFLLGLSELLAPEVELGGVDISPTMLRQARKILDGLRPDREVALSQYLGELFSIKPQKGKSLLLFTHSLNEMTPQQGIDYAKALNPDSILLIEPGTKESFGKALKLREWAISQDYHVTYPCFSNASCPLNLEQDWCHQFIQVTHSDDVERMTQKLHRNRRLLPMVVQLYQKQCVERSDNARLIRVKTPTKHSLEWQLCHRDGEMNAVFDAEISKRGYSKKEIKELEDINAGIDVRFEVEKRMEQKSRIKLL